MSADCLFCKFVRREIVADEVHRDDDVLAFRDRNPQAPQHVLVIPTQHAEHLSAFTGQGGDARAARLLSVAATLGRELGGDGGYRIVANEGRDAGQTVFHLHLHVLAGRPMTWPPG